MMSWYLSVSGLLRDQGSFENVKCLGSKFGERGWSIFIRDVFHINLECLLDRLRNTVGLKWKACMDSCGNWLFLRRHQF